MRKLLLLGLLAAPLNATPLVISTGQVASSIIDLSIAGNTYNIDFVYGTVREAYFSNFPIDRHATSMLINDLLTTNHINRISDGNHISEDYAIAPCCASGFPIEINWVWPLTGVDYSWFNDHESATDQDLEMYATITPNALQVKLNQVSEPQSLILLLFSLGIMTLARRITCKK